MFTGIIEETGQIRTLQRSAPGAALVVSAKLVLDGLKTGDSVAVNGVCLTATRTGTGEFSADLSRETLERSSFGQARAGTAVNLERPLSLGARLGGHLVQGHVDGTGRLVSIAAVGDGTVMTFEFPPDLERYLVVKGSIAVDGVSLTVASLEKRRFSVAVIPHTLRQTNLRQLVSGDTVNLEVDMFAKYIERFFQLGLVPGKTTALTVDYLKEQGF